PSTPSSIGSRISASSSDVSTPSVSSTCSSSVSSSSSTGGVKYGSRKSSGTSHGGSGVASSIHNSQFGWPASRCSASRAAPRVRTSGVSALSGGGGATPSNSSHPTSKAAGAGWLKSRRRQV